MDSEFLFQVLIYHFLSRTRIHQGFALQLSSVILPQKSSMNTALLEISGKEFVNFSQTFFSFEQSFESEANDR